MVAQLDAHTSGMLVLVQIRNRGSVGSVVEVRMLATNLGCGEVQQPWHESDTQYS